MANISLRTFLHPRYWYAWPILTFVRITSWLPNRILWILGNTLGSFFSWFQSPARRVAERNIELCFPEMEPQERRDLVKKHLRLSGYAVVSLAVAWWAPKWRVRSFIKFRDQHHLNDALANGKNVILLAPHFIGLDMGGIRLSLERKAVSMYRQSRNLFLEYIFQRRSRFDGVVVERMSNLKALLRYILQGLPFYYLPDQDMGERASVFAPFFGVPAATVTALSRIARSTNAAVIPCITSILPKGRGYEMRLYPPLKNFPSDDPLDDSRRMNEEVERRVREMPEQYMWTYRRFKTRPNNEPSLYDKK
jgi:KDO2-lipid IV(A) lauroyltransferase